MPAPQPAPKSFGSLWPGVFATRVYLPASLAARKWREVSRRIRGKKGKFAQRTALPTVGWAEVTGGRAPRLCETAKRNGNVRISELAVLAGLAGGCAEGDAIFEIGTFDGRTTLNLALNSPLSCLVYSLDLPPEVETKFEIAAGERHMIDKPAPGARIAKLREAQPELTARIHLLAGDSAAFDYTPYLGKCGLVFIDGSHAYEYAMSDTEKARRLLRPGGVIVWHDYGVWEGVTRALEELAVGELPGPRHVRGTSLVVWRG